MFLFLEGWPALLLALLAGGFLLLRGAKWALGDKLLRDRPIRWEPDPREERRAAHDRKRHASYPNPVSNTWYMLCDSDELAVGRAGGRGKVLEVRALGHTFALWRDPASGKPVVHEAFCPHLGANLAVGGVVNGAGKLVCPFHAWEFNADGSVHDVPYLKGDAAERARCLGGKGAGRGLTMYPAEDFMGVVMVWFHADGAPPEFPLPRFIEEELAGRAPSSAAGKDGAPAHVSHSWTPHLRWDLGHLRLHPTDWVDQAGDHAHFHTLHSRIVIPWTTVELPPWFCRLFPLSICHELRTYRGSDAAWAEKAARDLGPAAAAAAADGRYIFFTDVAGLAWRGKPLASTLSETLEMYVGPALMIFHIPFTLGAFKVLVSTTPAEQGSVMRVRTFCNSGNPLVRALAWLLAGLSGSQLASDIAIMENKIRLAKPQIKPFDGPYMRTNAWLKQFYSEGSAKTADRYCLDW